MNRQRNQSEQQAADTYPDQGESIQAALSTKRSSYSPEQTAAIKRDTINAIVKIQNELLERAPTRTDLNDLMAVQRIATTCMSKCAEIGVLPNFELLAAALGIGRRTLYDYIEQHPNSQTTNYLDQLRTAWASMRQMAADRGAADVTHSIFVLLNSNLGFTNQHQIEISQTNDPANPVGSRTPEEIREYYLNALPNDN